AGDPGRVPKPRKSRHPPPLCALEPVWPVADLAERAVSEQRRTRGAPGPVAPAPAVEDLVDGVTVEEAPPQEGTKLALATVGDEGLRAVAQVVAGPAGAQAEVHVLPDVAPGWIEAAHRVEGLRTHQEVGRGRPSLLHPGTL